MKWKMRVCSPESISSLIVFSSGQVIWMRPGTRIRPHHGYTNARLICHLPLIVPSECALRVGNETHAWREGEVIVFDDSVEHEAWNLSKEPRVVMIFDVWRPELSDKEQGLVATMLEAVDRFDAKKGG